MNRVFLKVTYRHGRPIAAYVQLPREPGDRTAKTDRIDDVLLVDRAADDRPLGVEITDPSRFDPDRFFELLRSLGQTDIDRTDFLPLAAA
jgi:hypothetical protein